MSNYSSRASDEPRPADDTGRRQNVPAGVGPMVNMQRGKSTDSFLAGITVLSSGFQRQPRFVLPVLKGEKGGFQKFEHEFLLKAKGEKIREAYPSVELHRRSAPE